MPRPMAKRAGLSISVKMILTTTFLILLTVVGFGALNTCNIRTAYDQSAKEKTETFRQSLNSKGATTTQVFASTVQVAAFAMRNTNVAAVLAD